MTIRATRRQRRSDDRPQVSNYREIARRFDGPRHSLGRSTRLSIIRTMFDNVRMDNSSDDAAKSQIYREMAETATSAETKAGLLRLAGRYDSLVPAASEAESEPADGTGIESV